ncbi:MAG: septum formation protein Maf [Chryseobacterium sp.]|nr:MAG: septum formation protein Maf [Chryseobacterium sp.]
MKKILLASQSPRRRELLSALGYSFETVGICCDEIYPDDLPAAEVAAYLSELKSNAYAGLGENEILVTADTVVSIDNKILGKPQDKAEAKRMLRELSGRAHQVYTGITLKTNRQTVTATDKADVTVENLTDDEIDYYLDTCQPYDKAGSYGIQDWFGMAKISKINGSFYTVMGLPTHLVSSIIKQLDSYS